MVVGWAPCMHMVRNIAVKDVGKGDNMIYATICGVIHYLSCYTHSGWPVDWLVGRD